GDTAAAMLVPSITVTYRSLECDAALPAALPVRALDCATSLATPDVASVASVAPPACSSDLRLTLVSFVIRTIPVKAASELEQHASEIDAAADAERRIRVVVIEACVALICGHQHGRVDVEQIVGAHGEFGVIRDVVTNVQVCQDLRSHGVIKLRPRGGD